VLRADWLTCAVTVPYVPTLGPVHPDAPTVDLFEAVLDLEPGRFLPYDKDQRWTDRKDETVLVEHTEHTAEKTTVTTLAGRRGGRVTVYHYAQTPPDLLPACENAAKLAAEYGVDASRVVWFQHTPPTPGVTYARALLAPTGEPGTDPDRPVLALDNCPPGVRESFLDFSALAGDGMAHLGRCWAEDRISGPVLVAVNGERVVGAIGPIQTYPGPTGAPQLLPQYLAVLPGHRCGGHGRALWRAAQRWGHAAGAAYQLLQVAPGSAADELYHGEGAHPLGLVCTVAA